MSIKMQDGREWAVKRRKLASTCAGHSHHRRGSKCCKDKRCVLRRHGVGGRERELLILPLSRVGVERLPTSSLSR
jgi:hypothetical protein